MLDEISCFLVLFGGVGASHVSEENAIYGRLTFGDVEGGGVYWSVAGLDRRVRTQNPLYP